MRIAALRIAFLSFLGISAASAQTDIMAGNPKTVTVPWTFNNGNFNLAGSSSGVGTLEAPAAASAYVWTLPAATANLGYQIGAITNGHCLQADGTVGGFQDAGATCAGGGASFGMPGYITGASMWYANPYVTGLLLTSGVGVANQYLCTPFWITQTVTIKALAINVVATSTGNSSSALQGAVYTDLVTTGNVHRPGTFVDYAGSGLVGFATGTATQVSATMANTTDTLTGPGIIWTCVQKFDTTATYTGVNPAGNGSVIGAAIGSASLGKIINAATTSLLDGVAASGSTYGSTGWANFTSSTTWTEITSGSAPNIVIQVN